MFTGLVECKGIVTRMERTHGGVVLEIYAPEFGRDMAIGDSVAVEGVCVTMVKFIRGAFLADVSQETLERSTLRELRQGSHVNLERAMRLSDRLGGHIVSGHVDAVGSIVLRQPAGKSALYRFRVPETLMPYLVEKGSVAVDGISLTVAQLLPDGFSAAVIPHTEANTTLGDKPVGADVNLEVDLLSKYVRRFVAAYMGVPDTQQHKRRSLGDMLRDLTEER